MTPSLLNLKQTPWVTSTGRFIYQDLATCAMYLLLRPTGDDGARPVPFNQVEGVTTLDEYMKKVAG